MVRELGYQRSRSVKHGLATKGGDNMGWCLKKEVNQEKQRETRGRKKDSNKASRWNLELSDAVLAVAGVRMFGGCDWLLPLNPAPGLRWARSM